MSAASLGILVLVYQVNTSWGGGLAGTMAAELVTGREVAFAFALGAGVPPVLVGLTSILQNLALAALLVPPFALGVPKWADPHRPIGSLVSRLRDAATRQAHRARNAWLLFAFMLLPFAANGAVVAGLIGVLAGMPRRQVAAVVSAAVVVTSMVWAYAHAGLAEALSSVHPALRWLPTALALATMAVTLTANARRRPA